MKHIKTRKLVAKLDRLEDDICHSLRLFMQNSGSAKGRDHLERFEKRRSDFDSAVGQLQLSLFEPESEEDVVALSHLLDAEAFAHVSPFPFPPHDISVRCCYAESQARKIFAAGYRKIP